MSCFLGAELCFLLMLEFLLLLWFEQAMSLRCWIRVLCPVTPSNITIISFSVICSFRVLHVLVCCYLRTWTLLPASSPLPLCISSLSYIEHGPECHLGILIHHRHPKGWPKRPSTMMKGMWGSSWEILHWAGIVCLVGLIHIRQCSSVTVWPDMISIRGCHLIIPTNVSLSASGRRECQSHATEARASGNSV